MADRTNEADTGAEGVATTADPSTEEKAKSDAAEIDAQYEPGARPTVTLPGTDGMVSGTAFADMVDDDGGLKEDSTPDA
ncbi:MULTISPECIES: hypothetical protein [Nocardiaceae]|jgi:hypothetical protein|uniref:hypothetical protein n=1 Tax=Nocardiaceae TaxID=85025 RepID=UPI000565BB0C|nr:MULTISPECIES: hypothetical protein [Rhodococcus]OZE94560.1 hypothetical protein CH301_24470 [Rhodococcus sp. 15-1189-1-1a]OZF09644.1 hypothetical protein CH299_24990 [Rhodococcus sp. 14-2686-1-2]OZF44050.1 hypothetical protein CH293_24245 [Rhodococcus sp. 14-2470-1b]